MLILSLNLPIPLTFAVHIYFVTIKNKEINRYDVFYKKKEGSYLYINGGKPFETFRYFNLFKKTQKNINFLNHIKGKDANKLIKVLERKNYPYNNKYLMYPGPNSNSYAQYIVDQVPELNIKLPWNAFGKNYKVLDKKLRL